jgi:hypothetical protein
MITRNKIYYLLDLHKKCQYIITRGDKTIGQYCNYVNLLLEKYFTIEQ